jgi:hypothetical protein
MRMIEDDKLPVDVERKEYSESEHALRCAECGFESSFDPRDSQAIGKPLSLLLAHSCARKK